MTTSPCCLSRSRLTSAACDSRSARELLHCKVVRNTFMSDTKTIAILGAGTMGNGIAHVCARSGFNVILYDLQQSFLDRGLATIEKNLAREVAKDKLTRQQADDARTRITPTLDREALGSCNLAIEAA